MGISSLPSVTGTLPGVQTHQQVVLKELLQQRAGACLHALPHLLACALLHRQTMHLSQCSASQLPSHCAHSIHSTGIINLKLASGA